MKLYTGQRWALIGGDCRERLSRFAEHRFDAVVTDPPYELGFMGKAWDSSGVAFQAETWAAVLRVLKPGGHLVAFGGSRTFHRIAVAIEDAGFEVRDTLCWLYGTGFPKSLNVAKAIESGGRPEDIRRMQMGEEYQPSGRGRKNYDHGAGSAMGGEPTPWEASSDAAGPWKGWGTALKPGWEPVILARKPLNGTVAENVQRWGTGALNVDGCRLEGGKGVPGSPRRAKQNATYGDLSKDPGTGSGWDKDTGRWPPNVCLDEEAAALLDAQAGPRSSGAWDGNRNTAKTKNTFGAFAGGQGSPRVASTGGASRFFYCPKASRAERDAGCESLPLRSGGQTTDREDDSAGLSSPRAGAGRGGGARNHHPTVKPIALMRWLVRLVAPPGGAVLDPFAGSGSTGVAVIEEGFSFCGVEQDAEYIEIARCRLERTAQEKAHVP